MRQRLALLFFLPIVFFQIPYSFAQGNIDTVSLQTGYTNQCWYSLQEGEMSNVTKSDWDLAMDLSGFGYSISINAATGTRLWLYPGDTADWITLDTAGISGWQERFNADTSWGYGAFSQLQDGFDIGWGNYDIFTHNINGDRLFVIKLANGEYRKVLVIGVLNGAYQIRHATLDNLVDVVDTIAKADFPNKNFAYFDMATQTTIDKEPVDTTWDLLFSQYTGFIPDPYLVTGVLQNNGVQVATAYPVNDPADYNAYDAHDFSTLINEIGHDWKSFNMGTFDFDIQDSLVYFVETVSDDIWKLVFLDFEGTATGNFVFEKTLLASVGIGEQSAPKLLSIYPNPANEFFQIVTSSRENTLLRVHDLSGRELLVKQLTGGLQQSTIAVDGWQPGMYLISLETSIQRTTQRIIVK